MMTSCQPITSASAGKIGRMYDDSFDPDRLKNTNMNAAQTSDEALPAEAIAVRRSVGPRSLGRPCEQRQPGQDADREDRHEIPPWSCALGFVGEETGEMLVNEEEIEELGVTNRHDDEPGHSDREEQQRTFDQVQAPPQVPVAREQAIEHHRGAGQYDADETLGQHRERQCCPGREHPVALLAGCCVRALRDEQAAHADAHPEAEPRVEREQVCVQNPPDAAAERRGAVHAQRRAADAKADVTDEQHAETSRQRGPCPGGPVVYAERVVGCRGDPVLERGLFEVLDAVQPRRDPISRHRHFARDLRVATFVGVHEAAELDVAEPDEHERQQQRDRAAPGKRRGLGVRPLSRA